MRDFTDKKYDRWKKRMAFILAKVGRAQDAEDAVNEFCARLLEGKSQHQTLEQFAIDYLRKSSGSKGTRGYLEKQKFINAGSYEQADLFGQLGFDPRRDVDARIDFDRMRGMVKSPRRRFVFQRYHAEGAKLKEIGEDLGVSESLASQLLSKAESEVARYLSKGLSNKEIADRLYVSEKTVKFHLTNIYAKTGDKSRSEFIANHRYEYIEKDQENTMSNWEPMNPKPLNTLPVQPVQQAQTRALQNANSQENVTFVVNTFKVNDTIQDLQTMAKEVTKGDYSVEKVMAACQCVGRMNETIQTVMKAAQVISGR